MRHKATIENYIKIGEYLLSLLKKDGPKVQWRGNVLWQQAEKDKTVAPPLSWQSMRAIALKIVSGEHQFVDEFPRRISQGIQQRLTVKQEHDGSGKSTETIGIHNGNNLYDLICGPNTPLSPAESKQLLTVLRQFSIVQQNCNLSSTTMGKLWDAELAISNRKRKMNDIQLNGDKAVVYDLLLSSESDLSATGIEFLSMVRKLQADCTKHGITEFQSILDFISPNKKQNDVVMKKEKAIASLLKQKNNNDDDVV